MVRVSVVTLSFLCSVLVLRCCCAENEEDTVAIVNGTGVGVNRVQRAQMGVGFRGHVGKPKQNKKKKKQQQDLMSRILPMMIVPFMIQTAMIPMVLTSLKFMLLKSMFLGKMAILFVILNFLRRTMNTGGVYSHNINLQGTHQQEELSKEHYGYNGGFEYGAYVNSRSVR